MMWTRGKAVKTETSGKIWYICWKETQQYLEMNCGAEDRQWTMKLPGSWFTTLMSVTEMGEV